MEADLATPAIVGAALAFAVGAFATVTGLDRERAFYSTVAIVVGSYYSLFAAMGGGTRALVIESLVGLAFLLLAVVGFRSSMWFVVSALAGHGIFDLVHGAFISNAGVPLWWPPFCLTYDVVAAGYLAWLIMGRRTWAKRTTTPVA
jgi:hypothetical protein